MRSGAPLRARWISSGSSSTITKRISVNMPRGWIRAGFSTCLTRSRPSWPRKIKNFKSPRWTLRTGSRTTERCIEWLSDGGMVNICYCLNFPELPLKGNCEETKHKLHFANSGLLAAMLDEET